MTEQTIETNETMNWPIAAKIPRCIAEEKKQNEGKEHEQKKGTNERNVQTTSNN